MNKVKYVQLKICIVSIKDEITCLDFFIFFELFDGLSKEKIRTETMSTGLNNIIEAMSMVQFSLLWLKELGKSSRTNTLNYNLSNIFGRAR